VNDFLHKFHSAQEFTYISALSEIKAGQKKGHWMWFIFPQMYGLGFSGTAQYYAIHNKEEALAYMTDPVLGSNLREITKAVLDSPIIDVEHLFGYPDNLKLQSCMTLFYLVSKEDLFLQVLNKYFSGNFCMYTARAIMANSL